MFSTSPGTFLLAYQCASYADKAVFLLRGTCCADDDFCAGCVSFLPAVVPPGYYFNGTTTKKCPSGSYRADWLAAAQPAATVCISCGEGVKASTTDQVKAYNVSDSTLTWFEPVTSSADDCCKYLLLTVQSCPGLSVLTVSLHVLNTSAVLAWCGRHQVQDSLCWHLPGSADSLGGRSRTFLREC